MENKTYFTALAVALAGVLIGFGVFFLVKPASQNLGGYLVPTITNTSSSVGITDTLVYAPSNLQFFYGKNRGGGTIDCTWTTTSTLTGASVGTGLRFDDTLTTSTEQSHIITDPNLLAKYMHCIANTAASLNILKY